MIVSIFDTANPPEAPERESSWVASVSWAVQQRRLFGQGKTGKLKENKKKTQLNGKPSKKVVEHLENEPNSNLRMTFAPTKQTCITPKDPKGRSVFFGFS